MVFVLSSTNKKLIPTNEYRARKLLKNGKAAVYKYHPFTIILVERKDGYTQSIEYCCDTGYQHIIFQMPFQRAVNIFAAYIVLLLHFILN